MSKKWDITVIPEGIRAGDKTYWRLESASKIIGLHPQSLQRLYRNSGDTDDPEVASRNEVKLRVGLKIGRGLFFSREHLEQLGYHIAEEAIIK